MSISVGWSIQLLRIPLFARGSLGNHIYYNAWSRALGYIPGYDLVPYGFEPQIKVQSVTRAVVGKNLISKPIPCLAHQP